METEIEQPNPRQPAQQEQQQQLPLPGEHDDSAPDGPVEPPGANGTTQASVAESESPRAALFSSSDDDDDDNASLASIPSDAVSEQITSPSVTSPPYWTHSHPLPTNNQLQPPTPGGHSHSHGHVRAVSSSSIESVLPPGAITLQDNERDEDEDDNSYIARRSNSSELYAGRDRNRACWARSVQVTDYVLVNGSATNIGAFVVWNIRVEALNGSRMNIRKRYSEFDGLRRRLVQTFPNFEAAVPALPPKSVLKRFHPRFLEKRRAGLQYFLNCILLNPEFSGSPVLKEFLFS